jgi:hypothetical protein
MKRLSLVLSVALMLAGGAYGRGWLDSERGKHPALEAFEAFYWKLSERPRGRGPVVPGSEAELASRRPGDATGPAGWNRAGLPLDVSHEDDGTRAGMAYGQATVNVDPGASLRSVPELHEVEALLIEDGATGASPRSATSG